MGNTIVKNTTLGSEDNTIDNNNQFLRYIEGILEDTATMQNSNKKAAKVACTSGLVWKNRKPYVVTGSGACGTDNNYKTVRNRIYEMQMQSGDTAKNSDADKSANMYSYSPSEKISSANLSKYVRWCNIYGEDNDEYGTTCVGNKDSLKSSYSTGLLIDKADAQLKANSKNIDNAKEELCTLAQTNISNCIRQEKLVDDSKTDAEIYNTCNSVSPSDERIEICSQKCKEAICPAGTEAIDANKNKTCPIDSQYSNYKWLTIDKNTCNRVDIDPNKSCCKNKSCAGADAVPTNGTKGNCSSALVHETSCTPTCNSGYEASGERKCNKGTLTDTFKCEQIITPATQTQTPASTTSTPASTTSTPASTTSTPASTTTTTSAPASSTSAPTSSTSAPTSSTTAPTSTTTPSSTDSESDDDDDDNDDDDDDKNPEWMLGLEPTVFWSIVGGIILFLLIIIIAISKK